MVDHETKIISSISSKQTNIVSTIHNTCYKKLGVNYIYIPLTVQDCKKAIEGIKSLNFRGTTVSTPYKQEILDYLDFVEPIAKKIGAVNTVSYEQELLIGYNSDWIGAINALKEETELENKRTFLIGAGGTARALAYGLRENKADVTIFNRTKSKAEQLARDFNLHIGNLEDLINEEEYDILINTTSVGSYPNYQDSIIKKDILNPESIVMDVVFKPLETKLLSYAKERGCKVIPGYSMLVHQAAFQIELFTGHKAPIDLMKETVQKMIEEKKEVRV